MSEYKLWVCDSCGEEDRHKNTSLIDAMDLPPNWGSFSADLAIYGELYSTDLNKFQRRDGEGFRIGSLCPQCVDLTKKKISRLERELCGE